MPHGKHGGRKVTDSVCMNGFSLREHLLHLQRFRSGGRNHGGRNDELAVASDARAIHLHHT